MKQSGATLLELMVVLTIAVILLTVGIPGFASLIRSSRLSGATNELIGALHLARSEAIKRNVRAVMCPSATGGSCAGSGGWHQGWILFHDANNNAVLDIGEVVILTRSGLAAGLRLTGNQPVSLYISYTPEGVAELMSGAFQAGTLTVCEQSPGPTSARQIIISSTGRPRSVKTTIGACI